MSVEQITLKDIAKRLNVSPSTVSRALKDNPEIGESTRKAIQKLAEELNYQPNAVALSLRKRKTFTIGVVVPEIVHYFFSSVISGIEDEAHSNNYQVVLCQSSEKYEHEVRNLKTLAQSQVDGILISHSKETRDFEHIWELRNKGVPVVFYDRTVPNVDLAHVAVDDVEGAFQATNHLIEVGCKNIVHMYGPMHIDIHEARFEGYKKALKKHAIPLRDELVVAADNFQMGQTAIDQLLANKTAFDGLFAVNDMTAVGAMKAMKRAGIRIPEDVAVVGFGDDSALSEMVDPALSSVYQPGFDMGRKAAQLLMQIIDDKNGTDPQKIQLKTELHIRESSTRVAQ